MKGISEKSMRQHGIYIEQSRDKKLVMLVFNRDRITKIGGLDKNLYPINFTIKAPTEHTI